MPSSRRTPTNPMLWITFGIVVLAVAGVGLYITNLTTDNANNANASNSVRELKTYTDPAAGFSIRYPDNWTAHKDKLPFPGATVAIDNAAISNSCGCSIYLTVEDNPNRLSIDEWLNSAAMKKDTYISQREYLAETGSTNETVKQFAGSYTEQAVTISNIQGLQQIRNSEGGGYKRVLIPNETTLYVITAWSDAFYFSDNDKQTDDGVLAQIADSIIESFTLTP